MDKYDVLFVFNWIKKLYEDRSSLYKKYLIAKINYMKINIYTLRLKNSNKYLENFNNVVINRLSGIKKVGYLNKFERR